MADDGWRHAVTLRLAEAGKTNKRIGHKKTRTGCYTCKIRRVKCDETKPACERCTKTRRKCDGYQSDQRATIPDATVFRQPLILIDVGTGDRRAFDYFVRVTAPSLAGPLDGEFWCRQVLQIAHAQPFVRHAVLAISTLYEHPVHLASTRVSGRGSSLNSTEASTLHDVGRSTADLITHDHARALRQYNRSISAFKQQTEAGRGDVLQALLSCVLFICIEVIRDDVPATMALITRGGELLKQASTQSFTGEECALYDALRLKFERLSILAATFGHPHPAPFQYDCTSTLHIPETFEDLHAARASLFTFIICAYGFMKQALQYMSLLLAIDENPIMSGEEKAQVRIYPRRPDEETIREQPEPVRYLYGFTVKHWPYQVVNNHRSIPDLHDIVMMRAFARDSGRILDDLLQHQTLLRSYSQRWYHALQRTPGDDPEAVASLLMYYHMAEIWGETRLSPAESAFDAWSAVFEQLIQQAKIYVECNFGRNINFTFENGALPVLYFAASKCRVPSLRRKALILMSRSPDKECLWGATTTAQLAARMIAYEEQGLGLPDPFSPIEDQPNDTCNINVSSSSASPKATTTTTSTTSSSSISPRPPRRKAKICRHTPQDRLTERGDRSSLRRMGEHRRLAHAHGGAPHPYHLAFEE